MTDSDRLRTIVEQIRDMARRQEVLIEAVTTLIECDNSMKSSLDRLVALLQSPPKNDLSTSIAQLVQVINQMRNENSAGFNEMHIGLARLKQDNEINRG